MELSPCIGGFRLRGGEEMDPSLPPERDPPRPAPSFRTGGSDRLHRGCEGNSAGEFVTPSIDRISDMTLRTLLCVKRD